LTLTSVPQRDGGLLVSYIKKIRTRGSGQSTKCRKLAPYQLSQGAEWSAVYAINGTSVTRMNIRDFTVHGCGPVCPHKVDRRMKLRASSINPRRASSGTDIDDESIINTISRRGPRSKLVCGGHDWSDASAALRRRHLLICGCCDCAGFVSTIARWCWLGVHVHVDPSVRLTVAEDRPTNDALIMRPFAANSRLLSARLSRRRRTRINFRN